MRVYFVFFILVSLFYPFIGISQIRGGDIASQEFQVLLENRKKRYEDFYIRIIEMERHDRERLRGIEAKKERREERRLERERAREEFIKERKARPELDPSRHEAELEARKEEREQERLDYLRRRNEMRRAMRAFEIPDSDEYRIFPEDHLN